MTHVFVLPVPLRSKFHEAIARPALWTLAFIHAKEAVEWITQIGQLAFGHLLDLLWERSENKLVWICGEKDGDEEGISGELKSLRNEIKKGPEEVRALREKIIQTAALAHPALSLETAADLLFLVVGYLAIVPQTLVAV